MQAKVEAMPGELAGRTFGAARHLYRDAVVAGVLRAGKMHTDCDAMRLEPSDLLVLFTHAGAQPPRVRNVTMSSRAVCLRWSHMPASGVPVCNAHSVQHGDGQARRQLG